MCIILFAALAVTACSKDNEFPKGSTDGPNAGVPDAYASIAITIPHTTMTKAVSSRAVDPGTSDENKVKTLHVFIYDADSPNEFAQEISQLADQTNGFVMFNANYPENTPAANLYDNESLA